MYIFWRAPASKISKSDLFFEKGESKITKKRSKIDVSADSERKKRRKSRQSQRFPYFCKQTNHPFTLKISK